MAENFTQELAFGKWLSGILQDTITNIQRRAIILNGTVTITLQNITLGGFGGSFSIGIPASGNLLGWSLGSTITPASLPSGLTIDTTAHTWSWSGTGTVATNSFTFSEVLAGATNTPHVSTVNYSIISVPTLGTLTFSSTNFAVGSSASGTIGGATTASVITASGLPTGLTIDSASRTWAWDGTGTISSGSFTLTETLAGATNTPHNSVISYAVVAAVLAAGTIAFDSVDGWVTGQNPPALAITTPSDGSVTVGDWYRVEHSQNSFATSLFTSWTQLTSDNIINSTESGGFVFNWDTPSLPAGATSFRLFFGRGANAGAITLQSPASNIIIDTLAAPAPTNLILNGTFDDTSVWTIGGANGGTTISGGVLNCSGNSGMCSQPITYSNGGTYQLDFDYTCTVGQNIAVNLSTTNGANDVVTSPNLTVDGASHHVTMTFVANVTSGFMRLEAANVLFTGTIDNVVLIRTA